MKQNITSLRASALLTAAGLLCLVAGSAECQRGGRQAARAGSTSAASSTTAMTCPTGGTSTGTGSTTTTTTSGTTTTAAAIAAQRSVFLNQGSTRSVNTSGLGSNGFSAQLTAANQALVRWSGATANAQRVYIGVLSANGQVIDQAAVDQLPVQANLTITSAARYYGVRVVYANGTSSTYYAPIR